MHWSNNFKGLAMTETVAGNSVITGGGGRLLGWVSASASLLGVLSFPVYTAIAIAVAPEPIFPWPVGGWPLPGIPWLLEAFLVSEIVALVAGIWSRGTRLGRVGLYGAIGTLSFCVVWAVSAVFGFPL